MDRNDCSSSELPVPRTAAGPALLPGPLTYPLISVLCEEYTPCQPLRDFVKVSFLLGRFAATLSLFLLAAASGLAQSAAKKPVKPEAKKEPEVKEELTLKNDDKLTGRTAELHRN